MTVVSPEQRPAGDETASTPDATSGDDDGGRRLPTVGVPEFLRRATWRFYLFAPLLVALVLAAPLLAWKGFSILRNEETGSTVAGAPTDPDEPGFEALVTPTPTALLLDKAADGSLAGATLITRPSQSGGNVIFFPVGTVLEVPLRQPPEATLVEIYAEGGAPALEQRVETMLGAGIGEVIEVPSGQWANLVAPVAPLTVQNPVGVETTDEAGQPLSFPEGEIQLEAAQVGPYLQADTDDQADTVRLSRHEAFWTAWLTALESAGDAAVPGEGTAGIGGAVRGLVGGPQNLAILPASPVPIPGVPLVASDLFRPNELEIVALAPDWIPFPVGVGRLRTRLVMGVEGQTDRLSEYAGTLVRAGAEITVIANDDDFDEEQTVVVYFREADREKAQRLLDALGTGELVRESSLNETVDVIVVLGRDLVGGGEGAGTAPTAPSGVPTPGSVPTGDDSTGGIPGVAPGAPGGEQVG